MRAGEGAATGVTQATLAMSMTMPAPIAVLSAFSRSLSSQPRRSATVPMTLSARLPRSPATAIASAHAGA